MWISRTHAYEIYKQEKPKHYKDKVTRRDVLLQTYLSTGNLFPLAVT